MWLIEVPHSLQSLSVQPTTLQLQDRESMVTLLVGARYGVSQVVNHKLSILSTLTEFTSITRIELLPESDKVSLVKIYLQDIKVRVVSLYKHTHLTYREKTVHLIRKHFEVTESALQALLQRWQVGYIRLHTNSHYLFPLCWCSLMHLHGL